MPQFLVATQEALVRLKFRNPIVSSTSTQTQYSEARAPISPSNLAQSLPALAYSIEFLEQIRSLNPFIRRIATRLYIWAKGINNIHLRCIASICFESVGGGAR